MSDPYSPVTTSRTLETPYGYRIYTTKRNVSFEFPIPVKGSALSASNFIGGFTGHYVLDAYDTPNQNGGKTVVVTHGIVPSGTFTEYESLAYTFPAVYPDILRTGFYPNGSRQRQRVVSARVTYDYLLTPGTWLTDPTVWDFATPSTGPFEVKSSILYDSSQYFEEDDGSLGQIGQFLENTFLTQDTINDAFTISSPDDSLLYGVVASVPSATIYAAWVAANTEIIASRTLFRFYAFYGRRTVFIRPQ